MVVGAARNGWGSLGAHQLLFHDEITISWSELTPAGISWNEWGACLLSSWRTTMLHPRSCWKAPGNGLDKGRRVKCHVLFVCL